MLRRHLASFHGILQADAYAGFNKLYENGTIQEAHCMAHIRRKFYDLMDAHQSPTTTRLCPDGQSSTLTYEVQHNESNFVSSLRTA